MQPSSEPSLPASPLPGSIAIAGAWGYIGRKFLDVALRHGLTAYVHDPGPLPRDLEGAALNRVASAAEFERLDAEVFHLAVHPEHRRLEPLLARAERLLILNEKPMAEPERPERCRQAIVASDESHAIVLYDFPELYDPLTGRVLEYLGRFDHVELTALEAQRSKDREDPANPRNFKRMVTIQYQESVHCLAFLLYLLASVEGDTEAVLNRGVRLEAESEPYRPPNPEAYPYSVDGRCRYEGTVGGVSVRGLTDFTRGAEWAKRRIIRGRGDGTPFEVEVSYLEGHKSLAINGVPQPCDPAADSYEHVLRTLMRWSRTVERSRIMTGLFPNPRFARLTYQLSGALWRSCRDRRAIAFDDLRQLEAWDAGFNAQT